MDRHSTVLRAANPTFDEGLACASYLDQAAEGFFHIWLGPRAGDIIATAFAQPDHDLSYQHVPFAERDDVIVGMFLGYTAEQHRGSSREQKWLRWFEQLVPLNDRCMNIWFELPIKAVLSVT